MATASGHLSTGGRVAAAAWLDRFVQGRADRRATWIPVAWSCGLAVLLLGPALAPGYVLSYDMVWVPQLDLRSDFVGLATSLPRVVPSDAVVAVLDSIVPGMVLQKVVLLGSLVAGGLGAVRLVPDLSLVGKLAVISCYQWSPLVAERLLIGHWPVLIAWACLPWVLHLTQRWLSGGVLPAALPVVLVLGSLSASAGVVTAVALLAGAIGGPARRWGVAVGLAAAANAPWVVAGLLHAGSATTATDGAAPFALQAEGGIPAPVAAISLGGIWNGDVVPGSRTGLAGWLTAAAVVVLAALGLRVWRTTLGRPLARALGTCWVVGMGVALLTWALPDAVGWFASYVPGGGVVRDGARMLVLAAPAVATLVGAGVAAVVARVEAGPPRLLIGAGLVLLPVLLLVDASWGIGGRLTAVAYPDSYETMRTAVSAGPPGDVLVLPFTSFRRPEWNNSHVVLDPVGRYQPRNYLSSDVLIVGGTAIPGEDPRVARASEALAMSTPAERSGALAELGISIVVTDRSALGPAPEVAGRLLTPTGAEVTAVALEGRVRERPVPSGWYAALGVAWGSFVATAVVLPAILVWWRRRRRSSDRPS